MNDLFENGVSLRTAQIRAANSAIHPHTALEALFKECDLVLFPDYKFGYFISSTTGSLEVFFISTLKVKFDMYDAVKGRVDNEQEVDGETEPVVEEAKEEEAVGEEAVGEEAVGEEKAEDLVEEMEEEEVVRSKAKYSPSVIYEKIMANMNKISNRILTDRIRAYAEGTYCL